MTEWEVIRKEFSGLHAPIVELSGRRTLQPTRMDKQNCSMTIMNAPVDRIL